MRRTLKAARKTADKTQKEIATAIGISESYYRKIEAGTREGKGYIWDELHDILTPYLEAEISQRELRRNTD